MKKFIYFSSLSMMSSFLFFSFSYRADARDEWSGKATACPASLYTSQHCRPGGKVVGERAKGFAQCEAKCHYPDVQQYQPQQHGYSSQMQPQHFQSQGPSGQKPRYGRMQQQRGYGQQRGSGQQRGYGQQRGSGQQRGYGQQSGYGRGQQSRYGRGQQSHYGRGQQSRYGRGQQSRYGRGQQSRYGRGQQHRRSGRMQQQRRSGRMQQQRRSGRMMQQQRGYGQQGGYGR